MSEDIKSISTCPVCARAKSSTRPPAGLLNSLLIPKSPWSHIAVDFITRLPPSAEHNTTLTVVHRFSKAVNFIPLPKLPSTAKTGDLLVKHFFHGLQKGIMSGRGPQFTSQVWKAFCKALGATVSLSLGYHPQSYGQTERASQSLESAIRCVLAHNPASWSCFLL